MLDRDIDAGEDPESLTTAPANIKDDTTDPAEQKYLEYLHSVMDEDAVQELTGDQEVAIDPDGIMYLTAGSSSGSKYYDLVPRTQTYIAKNWQQDVPTYSVIDMTETTLTLNTYRTNDDTKIDSQFMIVKSADHSQLTDLIAQAEGISKDDYTADSYNVLAQALEAAKTVNADEQATTDEITNAYTALKSAMDALEEKPVQQQPAGDDQDQTTTVPGGNDQNTAGDSSQGGNGQVNTSAPGVNEKPSAVDSVKTGDENNLAAPIAGMAAAVAAVIGGLTVYIRRKRA